MKLLEFEFSLSVESNDKKIDENYQNFHDAKERVISKLIKILILNVDCSILRLESDMCQHSHPYFW